MRGPTQKARRMVAATTVAALACTGAGMASATSAATAAPASGDRVTTGHQAAITGSGAKSDDATPTGPRALAVPRSGSFAFLLELETTSTAAAVQASRGDGAAAAKEAGRTQLARVTAAQDKVVASLPADTPVLYRTHAALSAVAVRTDVANVAALRQIPGVKAVYPVAPKTLDNAYAVPLQGAPAVWQATSNYGAGTKVGIVDTGIDYTHANFGGPGTVAAYDAANAEETAAPDPSMYGPGHRVVGGTDLVGDAYNADDPASEPVPDTNPLDCNGHGSHVAGSAAGSGENADGSTYTGAYNQSTPFGTMKIGPGMAPKADLYAIRVFGCDGSTNVVAAAIDWAMDPNGDGNTADHLDVVNMSLGSDYGNTVDGDTIIANAASKAGVVMAISAGNSYDLYDVGGSPGTAVRAITSAASVDASNVVDKLDVTVGGTKQAYGASRSVEFDWTAGDFAGQPVVAATGANDTACAAYPAGTFTGKVVLVKWTQENLECGSVLRGTNLAAAGAAGSILGNSAETFSAGITGVESIPGVLLSKSGSDAIRAALGAGTVVTADGTVANGFVQDVPGDNDKVADFSSRGTRGAGGLKPDVTAVGATVSSTAVGTGNDAVTESGTSMASPMTAGLAALVHTAHPGWSAEQVKADIMNTAGQNLYVDGSPAATGGRYGPNRVGAGRIQAVPALANTVLAYVQDDPGAVSVGFGPIEVTGPMTASKTVKVQNTGAATATYRTSYDAITSVPGVSYAITPAAVTVPAGGTATVKVTFTVTDAKALTKTTDATRGRTDVSGIPIETLADASGNLLLTPSASGPQLRVPVYSAPRPASQMTQPASAGFATGQDTASLTLSGTGVNQGTGAENVTSVVAGLELQDVSDRAAPCLVSGQAPCVNGENDRAADIKYVGTATDDDSVAAADRVSYIGITAQAPASTPAGKAEFDVYVDADSDGQPDLVGYNTRLPDSDIFVVQWIDLSTGRAVAGDPQLLDNRDGSLDLAVFDSDTVLFPVPHALLAAYGFDASVNPRISYGIQSFSLASPQPVDAVGFTRDLQFADFLSFDVVNPGVSVTGPTGAGPYAVDAPGTTLTLTKNDATLAADGALGVLMVHFHNRTGSKAQVVTLGTATATTLSAAPTEAKVGEPLTLSVGVTADGKAGPTGTVSIVDVTTGATLAQQALTSDGETVISYTPTTAGVQTILARYDGNLTYGSSDSNRVTLTVKPGPVQPATGNAKLKVKLFPKSGPVGRTFKVTARTVDAATGTITFKAAGKSITKRVKDGKASARLKATKRGKTKVKVSYSGSTVFASDKATVTYRAR
jgi:subtilisin family serine protease